MRWIKPGQIARQVYALPQSIPWPEPAPPPSLDDYFLNLAAVHAAIGELGERGGKWELLSEMCRCCEEASEQMENSGYARALELLDEAESAHPCAFVHWQRCICHLELGHQEQAMAAAYHAATLAPRCAVFWRVFGELCRDRGLEKEASRAFERAFFGGERTPSVIAGMRASGLLVPNPAHRGDMLVSPAVARAILQVHIKSMSSRPKSKGRLRELAISSLSSGTTADVALDATSLLVSRPPSEPLDECLHAEALWEAGKPSAAARMASSILSNGEARLSADPLHLARMARKVSPSSLPELAASLSSAGSMSKQVVEELFPPSDPSTEARIAVLVDSPHAPAVVLAHAARLAVGKSRRRAIELASRALSSSTDHLPRLMAARVLLELRENEKACAAVASVPRDQRGNWGQFMLAEALWQLGHPGLSLEALGSVTEDQDEALNQNVQMRLAQCRGQLLPLPAPASISPTGRLVRPVLVSGPSWTSVVAPSGLPGSSYIRVQIGRGTQGCEYRIFEFSRMSGEVPLGVVEVVSEHDSLALAVDPDGKIFVGAKNSGLWSEVRSEE